MTHMERVGIRALQQNASAVVARVAAGEVIEITDRGRPVARLVPSNAGRLDALVAAGLARPATGRATDLPPALPKSRGRRPTLGQLLAADRDDAR